MFGAPLITLQNIIFPDPDICDEEALYAHLDANVLFSATGENLVFKSGGTAAFDTYFNLFSVEKWETNCELDGLSLALCGKGTFYLTVTLTNDDLTKHSIVKETIQFPASQEIIFNLSPGIGSKAGIISFSLKAACAGKLTSGRFLTPKSKKPLPSLAICITTFQREAAINSTIHKLEMFLKNFENRDKIAVFIVDNGQSLPPSCAIIEQITIIPNPNLGGAGGFARGLMAAKSATMSHCLFMDDDATFHLENIRRIYAFLTLAKDLKTAIAGAMISNTRKTHMWENGATFNRTCHPISSGVDLREINQVARMEQESCKKKPRFFYGGWWFFAFPVAEATHYPFPFFVRGDDINFSLANSFTIQTLSGVVSFQDDFAKKESATTLYLDLRNHLVQHLTMDALNIGRIGCAKIAIWFILRNAAMFRYETCEALLLAWQDVMRGPDFFADNADLAIRREDLKLLVKRERSKPCAEIDLARIRRLPSGLTSTKTAATFWKWTLNGHLIPFFGRFSNHVCVSSTEQGHFRDIWGASHITYVHASKGYTVQISQLKFIRLMWRMLATTGVFVFKYRKLHLIYRQRHAGLTSYAFWNERLRNSDPIIPLHNNSLR